MFALHAESERVASPGQVSGNQKNPDPQAAREVSALLEPVVKDIKAAAEKLRSGNPDVDIKLDVRHLVS